MTTYILIVYLWSGAKMPYPFRFDTLTACQQEAAAQLERPEAVAGTVCLASPSITKVRK